MPDSVTAPIVHLNGTSKVMLLDQLKTAFKLGKEFEDALAAAYPHARDYYVSADSEAFTKAKAEHKARQTKLAEILRDLQALSTAVQRQGRTDHPKTLSWVCNECGAREYTSALSEGEVWDLGCGSCGGSEWHLEE